MSKSLASYKTKTELEAAVRRRLASDTKGLGYWAAYDYQNKPKRAGKKNANKS